MVKRTERHVRKIKTALDTPAARSPRERIGLAKGPDGSGRPSSAAALMPAMPSSAPGNWGGSTSKDEDGQIGTPGNLNMFGFLSGEDYNPDLDGFAMFANYNKMRLGDAQVNATLLMLKLPLKGARWIVKPGGEDAQDQAIADFVQANLIDDDALDRSWQHVLDNSMLKFDFGCAAAEIIWAMRDEQAQTGTQLSHLGRQIELGHRKDYQLEQAVRNGSVVYATVRDLAPRLPRTFYRWLENTKTGKLEFLQQFAPKNGQYGYFNLPATDLALHVHAREGNNYYGRSVLRSSYPHWWWKQQLYRIDIVGHDRFHVGIPRAKLLENYKAADAPLEKIEKTLKGLRSHDRAYMVQPWGVEFDVYAPPANGGSGTSGIIQSIEHHNLMIARNILQSFAAQGEQRHGSFGAAKVTSEVYFDALQGEADEIGSELKHTVVKRLCDLNFNMQGRKYPTIACTDISVVDFGQIATAMAALAEKRLITPEDELEGYLRDLADAPALPDDMKGRDRSPQPPPGFGPTPEPGGNKKKPAGGPNQPNRTAAMAGSQPRSRRPSARRLKKPGGGSVVSRPRSSARSSICTACPTSSSSSRRSSSASSRASARPSSNAWPSESRRRTVARRRRSPTSGTCISRCRRLPSSRRRFGMRKRVCSSTASRPSRTSSTGKA
jgi:hypothetical protein